MNKVSYCPKASGNSALQNIIPEDYGLFAAKTRHCMCRHDEAGWIVRSEKPPNSADVRGV